MGKRVREIVLKVPGNQIVNLRPTKEEKKSAEEVKRRVGSRHDSYKPRHRHGF